MITVSRMTPARGQRHYEPEHIVRLRNGLMVLFEIEGSEFDMDHAKYQAARRWVSAVNNWGRLGKWDFMVCGDPLVLPGMLSHPS